MSSPSAGTRFLCACLCVAVGSLIVARWTLQDPATPRQPVYQGDPLWPAQLYEDVVVDGFPLSSFMLPGANSFFPDVGLYFLIRWLTGSVQNSMVPLLLSMMSLLTLGSACAVMACAPVARRARACGLAVGSTSFALAYLALWKFTDNTMLRQAFLPVHHGGAVSCALLGLALVIGILESRSRIGRWGGSLVLALLCVAIVASDRLFLVWFTGPVGLTLWVAHVLRRSPCEGEPADSRRGLLLVSAAVGAGSLVGAYVAKMIHAGNGDALSFFFNGAIVSQVLVRFAHFCRTYAANVLNGDLLEVSLVAWMAFAATVTIRAVFKRHPQQGPSTDTDGPSALGDRHFTENPKFVFYCGLTCVMFATNLIVFLLSSASIGTLGIHPWDTMSRYFMAPHVFAFYGWALLLTHRVAPSGWNPSPLLGRLRIALIPGATVTLLAAVLMSGLEAKHSLFDDYPKVTQRLDAECQRLGLTYGLGDYAMARASSLLSRENVKVRPYSIDRASPLGIKPFLWTTNAAWFWQPERSCNDPVKYEFILTHAAADPNLGMTPEDVTRVFGEPAATIDLGDRYTLMVYNRPEDRLHHLFTHDATYLNHVFNYGGGGRVVYPGGSFLSLRKDVPLQETRTAVQGRDDIAPMAFGPLLQPLHGGHYKVVYRTSSKGVDASNGHVYAVVHRPGKGSTILGVKPIQVGDDREVEIEFDLDAESRIGQLDFQTVFQGNGELTLHEVEVSRTAHDRPERLSLMPGLRWFPRR